MGECNGEASEEAAVVSTGETWAREVEAGRRAGPGGVWEASEELADGRVRGVETKEGS